MSNLSTYLDTLEPEEVQALHDIALAAFQLKITNSDPETLQIYEQILQPAIKARACDGWLLRWQPQAANYN